MKSLKLDHQLAVDVVEGRKTSTLRLFDDKDLHVGDTVGLIDKVDPGRPETWRVIGRAHITQVLEKRLGDLGPDDLAGHQVYESPEAMLAYFRERYGDDVDFGTTAKLISFEFSPQTEGGVPAEITTTHVQVYTDGGSRGNPGPSASGFVVLDAATHAVLVDRGTYLGITTNNQAEYLGLKYALEEARRIGAQEVEVFMDSMLVVNQMKGIFKVKNRDLWPIHDAIKELAGGFKRVTFTHVPREMNKLADAAVNRALDERLGLGAAKGD